MDDFPHHQHISFNHHKRKADAEDGPDPSSSDPLVSTDSILVDSSSPSLNAPRLSWLSSDLPKHPVWPSPTTPTSPVSHLDFPPPPPPPTPPSIPHLSSQINPAKRPRLEKPLSSLSRLPTPLRRSPRKHPSSTKSPLALPTIPPRRTRRLVGDISDTGIIPNKSPGPTTGSLLRPTSFSAPTTPVTKPLQHLPPSVTFNPIDPNSPHIPSPHPLINRQTLKELDLDAILRNPQLRTCKIMFSIIYIYITNLFLFFRTRFTIRLWSSIPSYIQ